MGGEGLKSRLKGFGCFPEGRDGGGGEEAFRGRVSRGGELLRDQVCR